MGTNARGYFRSDIPKVKAYDGALPKDERGFEFTTAVAPDAGCVPGKPTWSGERLGVTLRRIGTDDFAVISCIVGKEQ